MKILNFKFLLVAMELHEILKMQLLIILTILLQLIHIK